MNWGWAGAVSVVVSPDSCDQPTRSLYSSVFFIVRERSVSFNFFRLRRFFPPPGAAAFLAMLSCVLWPPYIQPLGRDIVKCKEECSINYSSMLSPFFGECVIIPFSSNAAANNGLCSGSAWNMITCLGLHASAKATNSLCPA